MTARLPTVATGTGVILAGGRSRRMGQPKAALIFDGKPLLQRVASRLLMVVPQVLVVGPPELSPLIPELALLADLHSGVGPLAGLEAALGAITTDVAFVVACDMPFIDPVLVKSMLEYAWDDPEADVVALATPAGGQGTGMEHLHAVYRVSCLPAIARQIAGGSYALHQLFTELHVQTFPPDTAARLDPAGLSTLNVNTPQDWLQALELASTLYHSS